MVIVFTGPMGCGKSTLGHLLSSRLGWRFLDGDDYHPRKNKAKMKAGIPLDDDDRRPWLQRLHAILQEAVAKDENMILACSALKRSYRHRLGIDQRTIRSVFLKGTAELLERRIAARTHDYMNASLLQSQLETLEEPETGLIVNIDASPDDILDDIISALSIN